MVVRKQYGSVSLIYGLFDQVSDSTVIFYDNQSCVNLLEKSMFHDKSKHIEIKYNYIHD
jgi:hypothetical protein